jgi:hypothetical protein
VFAIVGPLKLSLVRARHCDGKQTVLVRDAKGGASTATVIVHRYIPRRIPLVVLEVHAKYRLAIARPSAWKPTGTEGLRLKIRPVLAGPA